MHAPDMAARFAHEGAELIASSPSQFAAHIKAEIARWGKVVKEAERVAHGVAHRQQHLRSS